jgi:hypothetical protein
MRNGFLIPAVRRFFQVQAGFGHLKFAIQRQPYSKSQIRLTVMPAAALESSERIGEKSKDSHLDQIVK